MLTKWQTVGKTDRCVAFVNARPSAHQIQLEYIQLLWPVGVPLGQQPHQ